MQLLTADEIISISNKYTDNFERCKKVFILSPPRSASTILSLLLNLNPKFCIQCESGIENIFTGNLTEYHRLMRVSRLNSQQLSKLVIYKNNGAITFRDLMIYIFQYNKLMRSKIEQNHAIGDKTPQTFGKIKFINWLNENISNCYFPGILKTELMAILKSVVRTWINDKKNRTNESIINDIESFANELVTYVTDLYNIITENNQIQIKLFSYSDFIKDPGMVTDYFYNWILEADNDFTMGTYSVEKYNERLLDILSDPLYGYRGHHYMSGARSKDGLSNHQLGLLENIKESYVKYDDTEWITLFDEIIARPNIKDMIKKYNELMEIFPFTKI